MGYHHGPTGTWRDLVEKDISVHTVLTEGFASIKHEVGLWVDEMKSGGDGKWIFEIRPGADLILQFYKQNTMRKEFEMEPHLS